LSISFGPFPHHIGSSSSTNEHREPSSQLNFTKTMRLSSGRKRSPPPTTLNIKLSRKTPGIFKTNPSCYCRIHCCCVRCWLSDTFYIWGPPFKWEPGMNGAFEKFMNAPKVVKQRMSWQLTSGMEMGMEMDGEAGHLS